MIPMIEVLVSGIQWLLLLSHVGVKALRLVGSRGLGNQT